MKIMSPSEIQQTIDETLDAIERQAVIIRDNGQDVAFLISMAEFEVLRDLQRKACSDSTPQ